VQKKVRSPLDLRDNNPSPVAMGGLFLFFIVFKKIHTNIIKYKVGSYSEMTEHQKAEKFFEDGQMKDIPGYTEEKQTIVDEKAINETFEPVNDALSGFRDFADWLIGSISDLLNQVFGNLM